MTDRPAVAALRAEWKQGLREGGHISDRTVQFVERLLATLEAESPTTLREAAQRVLDECESEMGNPYANPPTIRALEHLRAALKRERAPTIASISTVARKQVEKELARTDLTNGQRIRWLLGIIEAQQHVITERAGSPQIGTPDLERLRAEWEKIRATGSYTEQTAFTERLLTSLERGPQTGTAPSKVTRLEVIDHRHSAPEVGRAFVVWNAAIELSYQDAGRTLKVFVDDATTGVPDRELDDNEAAAEDATWD